MTKKQKEEFQKRLCEYLKEDQSGESVIPEYIDFQGIQIETERLEELDYFVKKLFQIITNPKRPSDEHSFQWRVRAVSTLEKILNADFKVTADFYKKVGARVEQYNVRKGSYAERVKKARKKSGLSQEDLASKFGYTSHVLISQIENGKKMPPKAILEWLSSLKM